MLQPIFFVEVLIFKKEAIQEVHKSFYKKCVDSCSQNELMNKIENAMKYNNTIVY